MKKTSTIDELLEQQLRTQRPLLPCMPLLDMCCKKSKCCKKYKRSKRCKSCPKG